MSDLAVRLATAVVDYFNEIRYLQPQNAHEMLTQAEEDKRHFEAMGEDGWCDTYHEAVYRWRMLDWAVKVLEGQKP